MNTLFKQRVLEVVYAIPEGTTLSYKDVAELAGSPRAFRAVGTIMKQNINPAIPCHRVICSNGSLGGYNQGSDKKKLILEAERKRIFKENF
jgi:O-6-methylguanine DNA methyltransferase